jgi:hypothetical protein
MKKIAFASALMIALGVGTGFATPINNLGNGQTALGVQDQSVYIEHKFSDNFALGLQENNIYGQFDLNKNLRVVAGSKDFNNDNSKIYAGVGLTAPLASNIDGYTSLVAGNGFKEMQVGANVNVAQNFDINLNYRSLMPDGGSNSNRTSLGATVKF